MRLHCIGDSHACFFLGYNKICEEYPVIERSLIKNIFCYRLGPALAYNLNQYRSTTNSRLKIEKIIQTLQPKKDVILLCFGEIDCRAHILKQACIKNESVQNIVNLCVSNYIEIVKILIEQGFKVLIWNAIYSCIDENEELNPEYPFFGTISQRIGVTDIFNTELKLKAQKAGALFVGINDILYNQQFNDVNNRYYFDLVHLSSKLFFTALTRIDKQLFNQLLNKNTLLLYNFNLVIVKVSNQIKMLKNYVLKSIRSIKKYFFN